MLSYVIDRADGGGGPGNNKKNLGMSWLRTGKIDYRGNRSKCILIKLTSHRLKQHQK